MHVWWNYPPCIQRCNKECLPFNTTLVLRGFVPGFLVTPWLSLAPPQPPGARQHRALHRQREGPSPSAPLPAPGAPPAHSWSTAGTGGHCPSPTPCPLLPCALAQPLVPCKPSTNAAGRAKGTAGVCCHAPSQSREPLLLQGSGPPTLPLPLRHLGTPSCSCARCSSGEHSVSRLPERRAARQRVPKMRSRVQATTREEKSDRWLDSGGATRKHEAGKGTAREGWGQGVPQR